MTRTASGGNLRTSSWPASARFQKPSLSAAPDSFWSATISTLRHPIGAVRVLRVPRAYATRRMGLVLLRGDRVGMGTKRLYHSIDAANCQRSHDIRDVHGLLTRFVRTWIYRTLTRDAS